MTSQSDATRLALIKQLADGAFHSGEHLSELLGISRAAISKHCRALAELGVEIFSVKGKGYRLAQPLQLLELSEMRRYLPAMYDFPIEIVNIIDSTNDYIKQADKRSNGMAVLAEAQTAGRGRQGRRWVSPFGASIYLSMCWQFSQGYEAISGLSLAVGVALIDALQASGIQGAQVKWPNDIYLDGKKVAGILVEVEGQMGGQCECVIGIGVNINLRSEQPDIDQPWTDLRAHADADINRNQIAVNLLNALTRILQEFEQHGLTNLQSQWQQHDIFYGRTVNLISGSQVITGTAKGIDHRGGLLLEVDGEVKTYFGGEISVRPA
ncbi:bifunctional biotin--[acetyl-CoA-carboxylase] ligase/biotin operon repressor BirA [Aestuariibacter salexigens]|uniref:bifunctional biotin--[acetyl-CoA-carboxylase] ligase/biotin operon repressor BirA n=1 Tax=Aestuariibacter salexigens TaxID=226010 RepID=UPI0004112471|nr:bifunctional biotin--[acetyl-CoA-carboxylase] ligase/biotin operon repressor BirA [Aestuariibacter salexigens]